jgi:hypothetical protein
MVLAFQTQTLLHMRLGEMAVNSPITPFDDRELQRPAQPTTTKLRCTGHEQLAQPSPCYYYLFDLKIPYEHSKLRHMTPRPLRMGQH